MKFRFHDNSFCVQAESASELRALSEIYTALRDGKLQRHEADPFYGFNASTGKCGHPVSLSVTESHPGGAVREIPPPQRASTERPQAAGALSPP